MPNRACVMEMLDGADATVDSDALHNCDQKMLCECKGVPEPEEFDPTIPYVIGVHSA